VSARFPGEMNSIWISKLRNNIKNNILYYSQIHSILISFFKNRRLEYGEDTNNVSYVTANIHINHSDSFTETLKTSYFAKNTNQTELILIFLSSLFINNKSIVYFKLQLIYIYPQILQNYRVSQLRLSSLITPADFCEI
jgi:hypothetical protein